MSTPIPITYDWHKLAHLAWVSRAMDEIEERELTPHGHVKYQFSASGHELGQLLLAQLLDQPFDAVSAYYRSRPLMLGIGLTPLESFLSGMAKPGGVSGGRDVGVVFNMLPRNGGPAVLPMAGDVGSQYTPAVGWAQAIRYRTETLGEAALGQSMAVVCGGDGSVATNGFWSSLTMATTLQLPVLFYIEDNGYAISVKSPLQTPGSNIAANLASFGGLTIWDGSGTEPAQTAELVQAAVSHVRNGHGPALLRLTVPRMSGHSSVDNQAYKSEAERADDAARDPLPALHRALVPEVMSEEEWEMVKQKAYAEVRQAAEQAIAAPEPNTADVTLYAFHDPHTIQKKGGLLAEGIVLPKGSDTPRPTPTRLTMIEAIRKTLEVELGVNPRCVVFGEDVGFKGGVHAATVGLQKQFGEARVFDTSLSEEGIIGRAVGMALAGLLPVPEIQFRKYADPATEQINNCGSLRWRTDNNFAAPIVVRIPGGYRKIGDPWHSVTSEVTYTHAVGWQMAVPSNAADAVGLLRAALRGNDPVIFFEHRAMLDAAWARRPYPGDEYVLPFGRGHLVQTGTDLTVVTWGAMVERCELAAQGIGGRASIELIDLRTLSPWDKELVLQSVRKTGKVLVVHEDIEFGGFGGEISAVIAAEAFTDLDAPVARVAAPAVMVPFSQTLMEGVVPTVAKIQAKMEELLAF